jgi:putative aldouronate transport system permease protein
MTIKVNQRKLPGISGIGLTQGAPLSLRLKRLGLKMWRHRWLYFLLILPLTYYVIFRYIPIYNAQIAFKDFFALKGVEGSPWVGFEHFEAFFKSYYFGSLIFNTVFFSVAKLALGLPCAIILALIVNESRILRFKGLVQTLVYLPHFLSWVIMLGLLLALLSPSSGMINEWIKAAGGQAISFLGSPNWFRPVVILSDIWKETGWSTILYLAALLAVNPELYEAAEVDGASGMQRVWHISLPSILPVIVMVTLLRIGNILDAGFNQIFILYSVPVYSVGDIIDTWVYRSGVLDFQFSLATAVGLFKGVIGLILIYTANRVAKRVANQSLF